jgi:hypothetical protein
MGPTAGFARRTMPSSFSMTTASEVLPRTAASVLRSSEPEQGCRVPDAGRRRILGHGPRIARRGPPPQRLGVSPAPAAAGSAAGYAAAERSGQAGGIAAFFFAMIDAAWAAR